MKNGIIVCTEKMLADQIVRIYMQDTAYMGEIVLM